MSIETATYVGDLQPANPPSTDPRGQGDDHLRLIKQVLQNSFPGLEKAIYFPTTTAKSANFSALTTDMNNEFLVATTGGAVTATLPSGLGAGDAGWACYFTKTTTDANPLFIAPATGTLTSGSISGLSAARRCIPAVRIRALWNGSGWIISRAVAVPIGTLLDFFSATLPPGFEWPNGQTLSSSANYPEYNSANGALTTLDLRGRVAVTLDNLGGSAAGRLAGGIITGTAVGNSGGTDTVTLVVGQIPSHTHSGTTGTMNSNTSHTHTYPGYSSSGAPLTGVGNSGAFTTLTTNATNTDHTHNFTTDGGTGGNQAHSNCQPSLVCAKILVVE